MQLRKPQRLRKAQLSKLKHKYIDASILTVMIFHAGMKNVRINTGEASRSAEERPSDALRIDAESLMRYIESEG